MEDVIVIGGGPAGSTAACELARRGLKVTVLEWRPTPGRKTCAGGLPPKAVGSLSAKVSDVVERSCSRVEFKFNGKNPFTLSFPRPVVHMVDRKRLDERLVETAKQAGAKVVRGQKVLEVCQGPSSLWVSTKSNRYQARAVVAADGAKGVGARLLGEQGVVNWNARQVRVWPRACLMGKREDRLACDFGIARGGIAWVFPKLDYLDVGVCSQNPELDLKRSLHELLTAEGLVNERREAPRQHPIPVWNGRRCFRRGAVLVAGDAAGLANPLTGAGIRRAAISGSMAAQSICAFMAGGGRCSEDLAAYDRRIKAELLGELVKTSLIAKVFFRAPGLFYRAGVMNSKINPWVEQLLSGQKDYTGVFWELVRGKWL